jgi:hypothetical protein
MGRFLIFATHLFHCTVQKSSGVAFYKYPLQMHNPFTVLKHTYETDPSNHTHLINKRPTLEEAIFTIQCFRRLPHKQISKQAHKSSWTRSAESQ